MPGDRTKRFTLNFSDDPLSIQEALDANFLGFELCKRGSWKPQDLISGQWLPIVDARVRTCNKTYVQETRSVANNELQLGEKPVYVLAEIENKHLNKGESTGINRKLRDAIRARGKRDDNGMLCDDCGHIVAAALGGKMVHFNLFPQNHNLNCGWSGLSSLWKWGVETLIKSWLMLQVVHDPMVRFHVALNYPETSADYPDRPTNMYYVIEFWKRNDESSSDESDEDEDPLPERINVASMTGVVENDAEILSDAQKSSCREEVRCYKNLLTYLRNDTRNIELREFLEINIEICENIFENSENALDEHSEPEPGPTTQSESAQNNSGWFWDLVPIVGSVRSLGDAIECAKKRDAKGYVINYTIGVGGLLLDLATFGTGAIALKGACQGAAKLGAKQVGKQVAKAAVTGAVKQAGLNAVVGGALGGALGGTKGAMKGAMRGAMSGICFGALGGGARGATKAAIKQAARDAAQTATQTALDAAKIAGREITKQALIETAKAAAKETTEEITKAALRDILIKEITKRAARCGPEVIGGLVNEARNLRPVF